MDDVGRVTEMIKRLPLRHRQRLIKFIWLLSQVDAQQRRIAIERLQPLLEECRDEAVFMERLEESIEALHKAIERDGKTPH